MARSTLAEIPNNSQVRHTYDSLTNRNTTIKNENNSKYLWATIVTQCGGLMRERRGVRGGRRTNNIRRNKNCSTDCSCSHRVCCCPSTGRECWLACNPRNCKLKIGHCTEIRRNKEQSLPKKRPPIPAGTEHFQLWERKPAHRDRRQKTKERMRRSSLA